MHTWREQGNGENSLTRETFIATIQSAEAIPEVVKYLTEEKGLSYVLTGKLQSDPLERRFSWYRQLSGANYYVSVRQVLEAEKNIRLQSLIKFSKINIEDIPDIFRPVENDYSKELAVSKDCKHMLMLLDTEKFFYERQGDEDNRIMYYISGGVARSLCKHEKCQDCKELLIKENQDVVVRFDNDCLLSDCSVVKSKKSAFLDQINRGGLTYPSDLTHISSLCIWNFYSAILEHKEAMAFLLNMSHTQEVFTQTFFTLAEECQELKLVENMMVIMCKSGHPFKDILKILSKKLFNAFVKNFGKEINSQARLQKRRLHNEGGLSSSNVRKVKKLQSDKS